MKELTPGLELGARFVLVRRIGRGGSAEVWLAVDRERSEQVALKFLDESVAGDAARIAQLSGEVARARALPPGLTVAVHGLEHVDDWTFLVMEFLEGGDLGQMRGRSFESWSRAADDVAAALEALHARGLVHRDLKCANIFLDSEGRARLGDFGLAALAGTITTGGSPYNASPQQLRGEPAQALDDLYAFGALLYELIAGHPPYYPEITRDRVLQDPVPPLVPRGSVPVGVRELTLRLLAKRPEERPQSAARVRAMLASAAADDSGAVQPLAHEVPLLQPRQARGGRLFPIAIAVAVVAAIGVVFLLPRAAQEGFRFCARGARGSGAPGQGVSFPRGAARRASQCAGSGRRRAREVRRAPSRSWMPARPRAGRPRCLRRPAMAGPGRRIVTRSGIMWPPTNPGTRHR